MKTFISEFWGQANGETSPTKIKSGAAQAENVDALRARIATNLKSPFLKEGIVLVITREEGNQPAQPTLNLN